MNLACGHVFLGGGVGFLRGLVREGFEARSGWLDAGLKAPLFYRIRCAGFDSMVRAAMCRAWDTDEPDAIIDIA